jgi:hypothetical protein
MNEIEGAAKQSAEAAKSNIQTYQVKLIEIAKENMQFALDFGQALGAVRSPTEFMIVTSDFTRKRLDLFQRHTSELIALSTKYSA